MKTLALIGALGFIIAVISSTAALSALFQMRSVISFFNAIGDTIDWLSTSHSRYPIVTFIFSVCGMIFGFYLINYAIGR